MPPSRLSRCRCSPTQWTAPSLASLFPQELGNAAFKSKQLPAAIERYSEALALGGSCVFAAVLHSNRAAAHQVSKCGCLGGGDAPPLITCPSSPHPSPPLAPHPSPSRQGLGILTDAMADCGRAMALDPFLPPAPHPASPSLPKGLGNLTHAIADCGRGKAP